MGKYKGGGLMERKRFLYAAVTGLIGALFIAGCANQGRLRALPRSGIAAAVEDIKENYNEFVIYANEWPAGEVSAIVFDPKRDNRTIQNDGWTEVTSKAQLSKLMERSKRNIYLQFFKIYGPNDQFFGYLLGGERYVFFKTIDTNTLKVISTNWTPGFGSRYDPFMY
jgi:hypothetical protein